MKTLLSLLPRLVALAALSGVSLLAHAAERVGVYDSRVIAYASFWSPDHQSELQTLQREARAARERGDTARFKELERKLVATQREFHLQVFSTAPIPTHLARLQPRMDAVCRAAGLTRAVCKWDEAALKGVLAADQVDITADLIRDLPLSDKQRRVAAEIATKSPLPLDQARALADSGKL